MREAHVFSHKRIMMMLCYGIQISIMLTRTLARSHLLALRLINQLTLKVCTKISFSVHTSKSEIIPLTTAAIFYSFSFVTLVETHLYVSFKTGVIMVSVI